ncbi:MAG: GntR family transcriptional regulator [Legionella sp.]|nr:GntR family transcriptional regulator [Legionella sp.]
MIKVGKFNSLEVIKEVSFGCYLNGDDWGEILLPKKVVPKGAKIHDRLDVFIYFDSDDKIIATTKPPRVQMNECACLKVIDVNRVGAFLDWGLDKDLLVPVPEQQRPMQKYNSYIVYIKQDNKGRIIASSKLDYFLDKSKHDFRQGEEVELLIADRTDLGLKVIINNSHWGLIHATDSFENLHYGNKTRGYIKTLREDGKIDVILRKIGRDSIGTLAQAILEELQNKNGFLPLHDKSTPEEIKRVFNESKKSFKSAIGLLYKKGQIIIEPEGIRLILGDSCATK